MLAKKFWVVILLAIFVPLFFVVLLFLAIILVIAFSRSIPCDRSLDCRPPDADMKSFYFAHKEEFNQLIAMSRAESEYYDARVWPDSDPEWKKFCRADSTNTPSNPVLIHPEDSPKCAEYIRLMQALKITDVNFGKTDTTYQVKATGLSVSGSTKGYMLVLDKQYFEDINRKYVTTDTEESCKARCYTLVEGDLWIYVEH